MAVSQRRVRLVADSDVRDACEEATGMGRKGLRLTRHHQPKADLRAALLPRCTLAAGIAGDVTYIPADGWRYTLFPEGGPAPTLTWRVGHDGGTWSLPCVPYFIGCYSSCRHTWEAGSSWCLYNTVACLSQHTGSCASLPQPHSSHPLHYSFYLPGLPHRHSEVGG